MRPPAQIDVITISVNTDNGNIRRQIVDEFNFVIFTLLPENLHGFFPRHLFPDKRVIGSDYFLHALFDLFKIIKRKGFGIFKIVIEPVFDRWTDGNFGSLKNILHGVRHHVGNAVAQYGKTFF